MYWTSYCSAESVSTVQWLGDIPEWYPGQHWKMVLSNTCEVHRRESALPNFLIHTKIAKNIYWKYVASKIRMLSYAERWTHAWERHNKHTITKLNQTFQLTHRWMFYINSLGYCFKQKVALLFFKCDLGQKKCPFC